MRIVRISMLSGKIGSMNINVTEKQLSAWGSGLVAQLAFPDITPAEREFIMTGITQEEWDRHVVNYKKEDSDNA